MKYKTRGCLHGKTYEMKLDFFIGLCSHAEDDEMFFEEQYEDLQPHEKRIFYKWVLGELKTDTPELRYFKAQEIIDNFNINNKSKNLKTMRIKKAIKVLSKALENDAEYKESFKSSIAMSFKDEAKRVIENKKPNRLCNTDIHNIANKGAENFLDNLMSN